MSSRGIKRHYNSSSKIALEPRACFRNWDSYTACWKKLSYAVPARINRLEKVVDHPHYLLNMWISLFVSLALLWRSYSSGSQCPAVKDLLFKVAVSSFVSVLRCVFDTRFHELWAYLACAYFALHFAGAHCWILVRFCKVTLFHVNCLSLFSWSDVMVKSYEFDSTS